MQVNPMALKLGWPFTANLYWKERLGLYNTVIIPRGMLATFEGVIQME